ncbi:2TM domain-containing protein [Simiduia aestuariiviva]|uniref:Transcriptional regulator with XRE-family HTH domain n=1 Tax=Simiduia aestuariiviva TaxID=1510459 RepID=A0A839UMJ2_9GAMM|nr:2TM domain-containing protein [Simiduia aestuariiviva]MBB3166966.1 transcriptional regulator with XRE-family HTH domain [Simiduia aestuariiviva]
MIIRKLRLQKGWSQEQLAQVSGLSVRTIQRIERGQTPGLETMKSLAAVFDVELSALRQEEPDMTPENLNVLRQNMTEEEKDALEYVRDLKGFYSNLGSYVIFIAFLFFVNLATSPNYLWVVWPALGWGIGVAIHGLNVFELTSFFGSDWERKQVEKRLGRKL